MQMTTVPIDKPGDMNFILGAEWRPGSTAPTEGRVLDLAQVDTPMPARGEVRLRVCAFALNPFDWKLRSGEFPRHDPRRVAARSRV